MASFEQWLEALQPIYDLPPSRVSELMCPNCGAMTLQLRFVTFLPEGRPFIAFWCGNCLEGIAPGPGTIPIAYNPIRPEDANIPNYRVVPPD
jgi:hypothetical protein